MPAQFYIFNVRDGLHGMHIARTMLKNNSICAGDVRLQFTAHLLGSDSVINNNSIDMLTSICQQAHGILLFLRPPYLIRR